MKLLAPFTKLLSILWHSLRRLPHLGSLSFLAVLIVLGVCQYKGYHVKFMPPPISRIDDLPKGWEPTPEWVNMVLYLRPYLTLFMLLGGVVYHIVIIRAYPNVRRMLLPTWIAAFVLTFWAVGGSLFERWEMSRIEARGEEFSIGAYGIHIGFLVGMFMSAPLALTYFQRCKIMERYVLKSFLQPLVFCMLGFFSLWVVMDLKDNLAQFQENKIAMSQVMLFYFKLLPFIYVSVAPVTLLLATLYSLGRMSRSNEIISMLGAGKSLGQVLRPIFIMGAYMSFLGMAANYEWAPMAEGNKKALLSDPKDIGGDNVLSLGLVYRNNEDHRTWFVGLVPTDLGGQNLRRVEVYQEDENGKLVKAWKSKSAKWWPDEKAWSFYSGVEVLYADGIIVSIKNFPEQLGKNRFDQVGWTETPWILLSGSITPEFLGVPTLLAYLSANKSYEERKLAPFRTHLFYRFAVPMQCLVIVLVAAALGVVFSRRGMLGGVASSVFIFFILLFIDSLFLKMGTNSRMAPWLAPWMPHLILGCVGAVLFYFRSQNRDFPKLTSPFEIFDAAKFLVSGMWGAVTGRA